MTSITALAEKIELQKEAFVGSALRSAASALSKPHWATRAAVTGAAGAMTADKEKGESALLKGLQYGSYGVAAPHILRFAANPIKTVQKSWKGMSQAITPEKGKDLAQQIQASGSPLSSLRAKLFHGGDMAKATKGHAYLAEKGKSLQDAAQGGAKGIAEELSRRGWTMRGEYGKYIPLGAKSMTTAFAAPLIPRAIDVARGKRDVGEFGAELGANIGFLAAPGAGLAGSIATSSAMGNLGEKAFSKLRSKAQKGELTPQEIDLYRQLMLANQYQQQAQG